MSQVQVTCTVMSPQKTYVFSAIVLRSERPEELRIKRESYEQGWGTVPEGRHHELLLIESPVWKQTAPDVPIFICKNAGKYFVGIVSPIETLEHAVESFEQWCVGTVYSIEQKRDWTPLIGERPNDFLEFMRDEFELKVLSSL